MPVPRNRARIFRGGVQVGESPSTSQAPPLPSIRDLTLREAPVALSVWAYCSIAVMGFRECTSRRLVNKPPVDAPDPAGWHHAHGADPLEKNAGWQGGHSMSSAVL
jgi:hypothetical protein